CSLPWARCISGWHLPDVKSEPMTLKHHYSSSTLRHWLAVPLICLLCTSVFAQDAPTTTREQAEAEDASKSTNTDEEVSSNHKGIHHDAIVMMGKNVVLKSNETADAVVVIGGSAKILGKAHDAVVAICGDLDVQGEVGDAAVAVL